MNIKKGIALLSVTALFVAASPESASAKAIANANEAETKALQRVENATVIEVDYDYDDGVPVYDVELVKGSKKYEITYRASDGKMVAYGWETTSVSPQRDKALISRSKCKAKAKKKVPGAEIVGISQKQDDGIDIYKLKMTSDTKKYTLVYHARTGSLIEYEWELTESSSGADDTYIGADKAKEIARKEVPGATVVKVKFEMDDGVPVYEVELVKGNYEYEFEIHAVTGEILKQEKDLLD